MYPSYFHFKRQKIKTKIITIMLKFWISQRALNSTRGMPVGSSTGRRRRLPRCVCWIFWNFWNWKSYLSKFGDIGFRIFPQRQGIDCFYTSSWRSQEGYSTTFFLSDPKGKKKKKSVYIYIKNQTFKHTKNKTIKAVGVIMGKIYVNSVWGRFYKPNNQNW